MLVLRSQRAVARNGGPAIGQNLHMRLAEIDHGLDREDHAGTHFRTFIPLSIVEDVRSVVEDPTDAVAAEIAHNGTTLALGIGLDGSADRADAGAGLHLGNAAQEAF